MVVLAVSRSFAGATVTGVHGQHGKYFADAAFPACGRGHKGSAPEVNHLGVFVSPYTVNIQPHFSWTWDPSDGSGRNPGQEPPERS